jgi:hypothetical protein
VNGLADVAVEEIIEVEVSGGVFKLEELQALNPKIHTVINNKKEQIHFFILTPKSFVNDTHNIYSIIGYLSEYYPSPMHRT